MNHKNVKCNILNIYLVLKNLMMIIKMHKLKQFNISKIILNHYGKMKIIKMVVKYNLIFLHNITTYIMIYIMNYY